MRPTRRRAADSTSNFRVTKTSLRGTGFGAQTMGLIIAPSLPRKIAGPCEVICKDRRENERDTCNLILAVTGTPGSKSASPIPAHGAVVYSQETVLELIDLIYAAAGDDTAWQQFLVKLVGVLRA